MSTLSIIVPIYNGEKRIIKCLDSILNQSYEYLELIVLNDGSKDSSDQIVKDFLADYQRNCPDTNRKIVYEYHENQGVAKTRNYGISIATGEYVTFVDQDDYLPENYCMEYMQHVEDNSYDIVVGGYKRVSDDGKVSRVVSLTQEEWSRFVVTAPWAHVYKRSFLLSHGIEFLSTGLGEDIYFNVLAYSHTHNVKVISEANYMWVDNPVSVSNSKQNVIREDRNPLFLMNQLIEKMPKENGISYETLEFFFARYVVWYFLFTVRGSKKEDIKRMYEELFLWLQEHFPNYIKNRNISLVRPKGEPFSIRVCVWGFYLLKRVGLLKSFLNLMSHL